jgi:hypothetical protein
MNNLAAHRMDLEDYKRAEKHWSNKSQFLQGIKLWL